MGQDSSIQWTTHTFNVVHGCQKISEACDHCYAAASYVVKVHESQRGVRLWGPAATSTRRILSDGYWKTPVKWNRDAEKAGIRARVFCSSLADVFEDHPIVASQRERLWPLIESTPWLDWQLLTKRPENIQPSLPARWRERMPRNVWLGCTAENQRRAAERIHALLEAPAAIHFLSCEPMTEAIDLTRLVQPSTDVADALRGWHEGGTMRRVMGVDWVICGGESGNKARDFDLAWARSLRDQCISHGVAFFMKQIGELPVLDGNAYPCVDSHGGDMSEWPEDLRIRQMPVA